jgi:hypothetical protein
MPQRPVRVLGHFFLISFLLYPLGAHMQPSFFYVGVAIGIAIPNPNALSAGLRFEKSDWDWDGDTDRKKAKTVPTYTYVVPHCSLTTHRNSEIPKLKNLRDVWTNDNLPQLKQAYFIRDQTAFCPFFHGLAFDRLHKAL